MGEPGERRSGRWRGVVLWAVPIAVTLAVGIPPLVATSCAPATASVRCVDEVGLPVEIFLVGGAHREDAFPNTDGVLRVPWAWNEEEVEVRAKADRRLLCTVRPVLDADTTTALRLPPDCRPAREVRP